MLDHNYENSDCVKSKSKSLTRVESIPYHLEVIPIDLELKFCLVWFDLIMSLT